MKKTIGAGALLVSLLIVLLTALPAAAISEHPLPASSFFAPSFTDDNKMTTLSQDDYPSPTSDFFVNDFASCLTDEDKSTIQALGEELYKKTNAQVVVVTVQSLGGRDIESYSIAITAAETGHLVLSTLHTIGAASTIDRIIDVFPPHQQQQIRIQLSMVLEAVISQQLIPTTDKRHRVAAFEVMLMTVAIKNLIRESKTFQIDSMIQTSREKGMITMDDALYELCMMGHITSESALSFAQDPVALEKKIKIY